MSIQDQHEFPVTHQKLAWLEQQYEASKRKPQESVRAHQWTLRSLKQMINQMKEEIARCEGHTRTPAQGS
jgi:ABC-type Zn uptake system ZnuABC Zn-binding protein ZnuA